MSQFQAVKLVALRELLERGRSKAYIVSTIFTLLILAGVMILPVVLAGGPTVYELGLVGSGGDGIVATAASLAAGSAGEGEEPETFEATVYDSVAAAEAGIDSGEVEAALVDDTELVVGGITGFGGSGLEQIMQQAASTRRVQDLVAEDAEAADVVALLSSQPLDVRATSGESEGQQALRGVVAFGGLVLMYIAVLTYGTWMLSGVTEEKTNRVVEVLLATLKPWHIFAGKLVGIGILGLGQMVVILVAAVIGLRFTGVAEIPELPLDSVVAVIGWFILGFALYATLFGAAGSLVSRMEDAQNAAAPLSILAVLGYLFSFLALNEPDGLVAQVGTYIPFTAPYVVPIRLALREIQPWEMTLAVVITVVTVVLMVRLAGRVYRGGVLKMGSRVKWREALRSPD